MINVGEIYLKKVDPSLIIHDDIEDKLEILPSFESSSNYKVPEMQVIEAPAEPVEGEDIKEGLIKAIQRIKLLTKEIQKLQNENRILKQDNQNLKQKITKAKTMLAA